MLILIENKKLLFLNIIMYIYLFCYIQHDMKNSKQRLQNIKELPYNTKIVLEFVRPYDKQQNR